MVYLISNGYTTELIINNQSKQIRSSNGQEWLSKNTNDATEM